MKNTEKQILQIYEEQRKKKSSTHLGAYLSRVLSSRSWPGRDLTSDGLADTIPMLTGNASPSFPTTSRPVRPR